MEAFLFLKISPSDCNRRSSTAFAAKDSPLCHFASINFSNLHHFIDIQFLHKKISFFAFKLLTFIFSEI